MDEPALSDSDLLRRHLAGDVAAFAQLRERYLGLVLGTCRRVTDDSALAEDAAQGVFLLLNERAQSLTNAGTLAGWLHVAARNVARNLVREETRRRARERRAFAPEPPEADWSDVSPLIDDALARLNAKDRDAVLMRYVQDRSLAQVGEALGVAENAARMRVNRAMERLREQLRRAGIAVSAAALATMLSTRMADAAPLPAGPPSALAAKAAGFGSRMGFLGTAKWAAPATVAGGLVLLGTFGGRFLAPRPAVEVERVLTRTVGLWAGELEYADDRDGSRHSFPAMVEVTGEATSLTLEARYAGTSSVDTTRFVYGRDGTFEIRNTGSHLLNGNYRVREDRGRLVFEGRSPVIGADVRITMDASDGGFALLEEIQKGTDPDYRFRNRFTLRRR